VPSETLKENVAYSVATSNEAATLEVSKNISKELRSLTSNKSPRHPHIKKANIVFINGQPFEVP